MPCARKARASFRVCVLLPLPSRPSKVMNFPRAATSGMIAGGRQAQIAALPPATGVTLPAAVRPPQTDRIRSAPPRAPCSPQDDITPDCPSFSTCASKIANTGACVSCAWNAAIFAFKQSPISMRAVTGGSEIGCRSGNASRRRRIVQFLRPMRFQPVCELIGKAVAAARPMERQRREHRRHRVIRVAGNRPFRAHRQHHLRPKLPDVPHQFGNRPVHVDAVQLAVGIVEHRRAAARSECAHEVREFLPPDRRQFVIVLCALPRLLASLPRRKADHRRFHAAIAVETQASAEHCSLRRRDERSLQAFVTWRDFIRNRQGSGAITDGC